MIKRRRSALCILLLAFAALLVPAYAGAETPADSGGITSTDGSVPIDSGTGAESAPLSLSPEQIQAMQEAADGQDSDRSVFQKVADFVTDNAPFFIIGIIVIAAIIAGILIVRGRPARGEAPAGQSAAERRRRKRAATQRAREEERLRRRTRHAARRAPAGVAPAVAASDPERAAIDAEKAGAADQQRVAGAFARAQGPSVAPYSPSQNAPAPGVVTQIPPQPAQTGPAPEAEVPQSGGGAADEPPTTDLSSGAEGIYEPSLEAPGADATVGRNAAAFAAAAGAGSLADRIPSRRPDIEDTQPGFSPGQPAGAPPASADVPGTPGPAVDDRLRSTLDDLRGVPRSPVPAPGHGISEEDRRRDVESREEGEAPGESTDLALGLAAVERRLSAEREQRDQTLQDAEERLRRIEQRAEDAERRAAFAERLTQLKIEESEREKRLEDVISGIERAEQRAEEAENRAIAAERSAAAALEGGAGSQSAGELNPPGEGSGLSPSGPRDRDPADRRVPGAADRDAGDQAGEDRLNLNHATFEQLREVGLSVTQATRVLAYRERFGGYDSLDDLDKVPGFPPEKIESMRPGFTV